MPNTWQDYADAAEIVRRKRGQCALAGPDAPYRFLDHVGRYLEAQMNAAFSPVWEGMRSDNLPAGANERAIGTR